MRIKRLSPAVLHQIGHLRSALWPDSGIGDLLTAVAATPDYLVLAAMDDDLPVGFAEIALRRDYVNGCESSPAAFLEGIYVAAEHRRNGIARSLVDAAAAWASERGVAELASDALLDNGPSHAFHRSIGFAETERVVYFRRLVADTA